MPQSSPYRRPLLARAGAATAVGLACLTVQADYLDDIGYRALAAQLGAALPAGVSIRIDQIEAPTDGGEADPIYRADPGDAAFSGVSFHDQTAGANPAFSGHATAVARLFAGNASMTPGVADVDSYEVNDWIGKVLFNAGAGQQRPVLGTGVLANHSWVGAGTTAADSVEVLQRLDWVIDKSDFVHVVGVTNASNPLLSNAYNVIGVTRSSNGAGGLTATLDSFYVAGRAFPHLVAPLGTPSESTAVVTAATALLLDAAPSNTLPGEVVKALLMAGAAHVTRNSAAANLQAWRGTTTNGLDPRYGAGQLDIAQSYALLTAGEFASVEDGGLQATSSGYDYDAAFGGANGSNSIATYPTGTARVSGHLQATLVWNAQIEDAVGPFAPTLRTVHNLDLQLLDVTSVPSVVVVQSSSTIDNTETVSAETIAGHAYQLRVLNAGAPSERDYAIAWRVEPDRDRDGLFDRYETGGCPAADDADSDDDGLADGVEDANFDGVVDAGETDPCDADTDGDGLQDGTELGVVSAVAAPGSGLLGTDTARFVADADPSTMTSPTDADTDGDGFVDGIEDANRNGAIDAGESDPGSALSQPLTVKAVPLLPPPLLGILALLLGLLGARSLHSRQAPSAACTGDAAAAATTAVPR